MQIKEKFKNKLYEKGLDLIRKKIPESSWKHEYTKLRLWFVCSDQYETRFKPMFDKMLRQYEGKIWNRGRIVKFDYWLCWIFLGAEPDDYFDFEFFKKGWRWRNHHITRQRLNYFVPIFNDSECKYILTDKSEFCKRWNDYVKRKWCVPQDVTYEEFEALFQNVDRIVVKPLALFGGKGIKIMDINSSNLKNTYDMLHHSEDRTIVEEYVYQKGFLHDVYPNALNPLRVCTLRIAEKCEVCYAFFTVGCKGNVISNDCSGGISYSIDTKTGKLGAGQGFSSNNHRKHPDTGVQVTGEYVPDWEKIKKFACEAHMVAPEGIRIIGWDVCWNNGELSLIEGNYGPAFPELPNRKENQWKKMQEYLELVFKKE